MSESGFGEERLPKVVHLNVRRPETDEGQPVSGGRRESAPRILSLEELDVIAEKIANDNLNSDKPRVGEDVLPQNKRIAQLRNEDLVSFLSDNYRLGAESETLMDAVFEYQRRRRNGLMRL